jgi:hypothetical protein
MGEWERISGHSFLDRIIGRGVVSFTYVPTATHPEGEPNGIESIRYWIGFGAGVYVMARRKILSSAGNRSRVLQTVASHFTDCPLRNHNIKAVLREICSKKICVKLTQAAAQLLC